jgi:hypothetical protein
MESMTTADAFGSSVAFTHTDIPSIIYYLHYFEEDLLSYQQELKYFHSFRFVDLAQVSFLYQLAHTVHTFLQEGREMAHSWIYMFLLFLPDL